MIARRLLISGLVQGVSYRVWAQREAERLGLSGWVRNLRDGRVEALACGEADRIETFVERCRGGPSAARVDHVAVEEAAVEPLDRFEIRRTP